MQECRNLEISRWGLVFPHTDYIKSMKKSSQQETNIQSATNNP